MQQWQVTIQHMQKDEIQRRLGHIRMLKVMDLQLLKILPMLKVMKLKQKGITLMLKDIWLRQVDALHTQKVIQYQM
jgi:hypothetical protein